MARRAGYGRRVLSGSRAVTGRRPRRISLLMKFSGDTTPPPLLG
nr:MAG TPA: hypothetical protein [Bacteriophage sp.]